VTSAVEVWRDQEGEIYASGGRADGWYWVEVPQIGMFRFSDAEEVAVTPLSGIGIELIEESFERIVVPLVLHAVGRELLHASAVVAPSGGVVAFAATTRTGKSTLAYALSLRGHPIWADDAVLFQTGDGSVQSIPLPFTLRIRQPSAHFFGLEGRDPNDWRPMFEESNAARPLAAICLLESKPETDPSPAGEVVRRDSASAFPAVLAHSYSFSIRDPGRKRDMLSRYMELTARVPVYDIRFPPGLENLARLLDQIEETVMWFDHRGGERKRGQ
jgi:hypothetical protein